MARRFVRSVTRIYVVFNVELSPTQSKKKSLQSAAQPLQRCKRVFQVYCNCASSISLELSGYAYRFDCLHCQNFFVCNSPEPSYGKIGFRVQSALKSILEVLKHSLDLERLKPLRGTAPKSAKSEAQGHDLVRFLAP